VGARKTVPYTLIVSGKTQSSSQQPRQRLYSAQAFVVAFASSHRLRTDPGWFACADNYFVYFWKSFAESL
jgi:hypothetical protein